jgi:hypothetical protein
MGHVIKRRVIFIIVPLMIFAAVSSIPLIPEITARVQVYTTPNHRPAVRLDTLVYQKVSFFAASFEPKDRVQVTGSTVTGGTSFPVHYYLSVVVQYRHQMIIQGGSDLTDGTYQVKASFWPRAEERNVPYEVEITVSQDAYYYATVEATVLPG